MHLWSIRVTAILLTFAASAAAAEDAPPVKIFILAGQSNMEGKAKNTLFDYQATAPQTAELFAHLRDKDRWVERDDVSIKFLSRHGKLTLGYGSPGRTGMEYEFGWRMGEQFDEPVLLIKTAWGGHSLYRDFRSPSNPPSEKRLKTDLAKALRAYDRLSDKKKAKTPQPTIQTVQAAYGKSYRNMLAEVADVKANLGTLFPELADRQLELAGFVWFQGWNDKYASADVEYADNMQAFIRDVRKDLHAPKLPFVIAVMGQGGVRDLPANKPIVVIQKAQLSMNDVPDFAGNVRAFRTDVLVDKAAQQAFANHREDPQTWQRAGSDAPYHYLGSAIWHNRIGRAAAEAMQELMKSAQRSQ